MAVNRKSEVLNGSSVFLEGVGFISTTADAKIPKIEFEGFSVKSGLAEHHIDSTVLKAMEAEFGLNEVNDVYFEALAKRKGEQATIWVKKTSSQGTTDHQTVVTLKGHATSFEPPNDEIGKEYKASFNFAVDFYKYEIDGVEKFLIDVDNLICRINGVDLWEDSRNFLLG